MTAYRGRSRLSSPILTHSGSYIAAAFGLALLIFAALFVCTLLPYLSR